jgi:uncharacterized repeat protein (TIGR01451 family)
MRNFSRRCGFGIALGLLAAAGSAHGQLVVGNDQTTPTIWLLDVTGVLTPRALVTGADADVWALAADEIGQRLFWTNGSSLYVAPYLPTGTLSFTNLGSMTGTAGSITGLAYDTVEGKLYGRNSAGIVEISITSPPVKTTVFAATAQDIGGFDYDVATNAFYGTNDSTSTTVLAGARGVYRINKPIATPTFTELTEYPAGDIDLDGVGAGNGRLYLVNDQSEATGTVLTDNIQVWNLTTNTFETPIISPFSATSGTFSGGAWAPGLFTPPAANNVGISISDPADNTVPVGGSAVYTISAQNLGTDPANDVVVTLTLPLNASFVSSVPVNAPVGNILTFNLGTLAPAANVPITVTLSPTSGTTLDMSGTIATSSGDTQPSNNTANASMVIRPPAADVSVTITDPTDCSTSAGGAILYSVSVNNIGPDASTGVVLTIDLPTNATFDSAVPPAAPVGNQLIYNIGGLASAGAFPVTINMTHVSGPTVAISANIAATFPDPVGGNNTDAESLSIAPTPPSTATIVGVISNIATASNSDVPGLPGIKFASGITPGRPQRSPDGSRWIQAWDTNNATTAQDEVLVAFDGATLSVVAQEGVTPIPTAPAGNFLDAGVNIHYGINNSGAFAIGGIDNRPTTADDGFIAVGPAPLTLVAQEATTAVPSIVNATFGGTRGSVHISDAGSAAFYHNMTGAGVSTADDTAIFKDNGNTILAREGVTVPTGQAGGATALWQTFDTGTTIGLGVGFDSTHTNWIASGDTNDVTTVDKIVAVNNNVVIQEGSVLAGSGFANAVTTIRGTRMESDGTWFASGSNITDGVDWVVRNGAVIAAVDQPIFGGATELFDDAPFATTFFMHAGNNAGSYVIGGTTNAADVRANAVLVLNGATVVARENDPVDVDGNGAFDDNTYIRTFIDDRLFMTDSAILVMVRLRDANAAFCGATDTDIGQALIRIDIGCDSVDFNGDGIFPDNQDIIDYIDVFAGGTCPTGTCNDIDFNNDGIFPDNGDLVEFIDVFAGGACG